MDETIRIGWAQGCLTPREPVLIAGQFHARVSEGVDDDLTVTALALEKEQQQAVLASCDFVTIPDSLRDRVRETVKRLCPDLDPEAVVLNATHTHTGPELRTPAPGAAHVSMGTGIELEHMPVETYRERAAAIIADTVAAAWTQRAQGEIACGQDWAVIGHNSREANTDGASIMYGDTNTRTFSHIEGTEDHSLGLLATRDANGTLTGLVVNVPCPSQVSETEYRISADYWHETRLELRRRFGSQLPVLSQCSAAGDQSPRLLYEQRAEERMLQLKNRTKRQEIASRIADAVGSILDVLEPVYESAPLFRHASARPDVPLNPLTENQAHTALAQAEECRKTYESERQKIQQNPDLRHQPHWYVDVTRAYRRMKWHRGVAERYRMQQKSPTRPVELHVLRIGNAAIATNPFEYYLDHGIVIKARSRAEQTFLVQLAGSGTYVPSHRSVAGGGYGSTAESNPVGPDGGRRVADTTVDLIASLWTAPPETAAPRPKADKGGKE